MKALFTKPHLLSRIVSLALGRGVGWPGAAYKDTPVPVISPSEILVKVRAVALNQTDSKHIDAISWPDTIVGCDFAGEVVEVGADAASSWSVGDRVAGAVHGGLYADRGSFAEFLKTDADLAWKIPVGVSDADATTFGISACTAMHALNARLGLPWADAAAKNNQRTVKGEKPVIFVYAGTTGAGLYMIQLAKAAGCFVVTTASPSSADLVKSYGADAVFDYNEPNVGDAVAKQYPGIKMGVDCFSEGKSFAICDAVLGKSGGTLITLLPPPKPKYPAIKHDFILSYTLFGRAFHFLSPIGPKLPAMPDDRAALARFCAMLPELINQGVLKPMPTSVRENGWDGILEGLDQLRGKGVRGKKLVVLL